MDDKDTSRFDDWQKAPTPSPLKASNTLETLRPREVRVTQEWDGTGVVNREEALNLDSIAGVFVRKTDLANDIAICEHYTNQATPEDVAAWGKKLAANLPPAHNVLPVDWPTAQETMGLPKLDPKKFEYSYKPTTTLEARISKLEGLVDGLLDRIALYNTRSSHKI